MHVVIMDVTIKNILFKFIRIEYEIDTNNKECKKRHLISSGIPVPILRLGVIKINQVKVE